MFVDSVVWIALKYKKDKWHREAFNLRNIILEAPKLLITESILTEVYNFLLRKVSFKVTYQTYLDLINSKDITIVENNSTSRKGTSSILEAFQNLSYTDANIVWHCRIMEIKQVMSFDRGFDQVADIIRINK